MKQVVIRGGEAVLEEVPAPTLADNSIKVLVSHSCVSVGTEMAGVVSSGLPLYRRALQQPENVKRVMDSVAQEGVSTTIAKVRGQLAAGAPTGYSAAGVVMAVGDKCSGFKVGDRVACAGAGFANHAEIISVPQNLAVHVPNGVELESAATVTLGAIALQGVRRANPTLGETVLVIGLGMLGQLTVQMLVANGCNVLVSDLDTGRVELALESGAMAAVPAEERTCVESVDKLTNRIGADAAIITAASSSSQLIDLAMKCCRKKGRVVIVGDVGLDLKRESFYKKELDIFISCSYGPGRYDDSYELQGIDYPVSYVRWTENRNMQAYLSLIEQERIHINKLGGKTYAITDVEQAYGALSVEEERPLFVLLEYPSDVSSDVYKIDFRRAIPSDGLVNVGLIGASSFCQSIHLPNMVKLRKTFNLMTVMSRTGSTAKAVARRYGAATCATDVTSVLDNDGVDLAFITTRHDLHGELVLRSLKANKHVFVEKPLVLKDTELEKIKEFYDQNSTAPVLMVGYNRRFSPAIKEIQKILAGFENLPKIVNYQMNAGFLPSDHWVHGPEGGGRNLGEACHIYDLFNYFNAGSDVDSITVQKINPVTNVWLDTDNFVASIKYTNGSICNLIYTALGATNYPKESMQIFCDGITLTMSDYKTLEIYGRGKIKTRKNLQGKGHIEELEALGDCLQQGGEWPITLKDLVAASSISLAVDSFLLDSETSERPSKLV